VYTRHNRIGDDVAIWLPDIMTVIDGSSNLINVQKSGSKIVIFLKIQVAFW
jgi:hypothetical protein